MFRTNNAFPQRTGVFGECVCVPAVCSPLCAVTTPAGVCLACVSLPPAGKLKTALHTHFQQPLPHSSLPATIALPHTLNHTLAYWFNPSLTDSLLPSLTLTHLFAPANLHFRYHSSFSHSEPHPRLLIYPCSHSLTLTHLFNPLTSLLATIPLPHILKHALAYSSRLSSHTH